MLRKILLILFIILSFLPAYAAEAPSRPGLKIDLVEPIEKDDRILIMAPHPDDETIGCAGIIQKALVKGAKVKILYLTNGDHNEIAFIVYNKRLTLMQDEFIRMGEVRRKEAVRAMELLGLNKEDLIFLGYPDFGTLTIFSQYWDPQKPFKSLLTRISRVPYKDNLSFGAPYVGQSILKDIKKVLLDYKPNKIFVSHPADTNGDHRALYLFLEIALRDIDKEMVPPRIYPYLIHCVGWPSPRHYHPELSLAPPAQFLDSEIIWRNSDLSPEEVEKKHQGILCYRSQTQSSAFYLLSFARKNELFSDYTDIELERQISLRERAVSFFGFSNMYSDPDIDSLSGVSHIPEDKGKVSYAVADGYLFIHIEKDRDLKHRLRFLVYLFGYSKKTPFARMPKISIIIKYNKFRVFAAKEMINPVGISLRFKPTELVLKVPLKFLGKPDFILTSMRSYIGTIPIDAIAFRKIEIQ